MTSPVRWFTDVGQPQCDSAGDSAIHGGSLWIALGHQVQTLVTNVADESTRKKTSDPDVDANANEVEHSLPDGKFRWLAILAGLSIGIYALITLLSWRFEFNSTTTERPIIAVLGLFAIAFAIYLVATAITWHANERSRMLKLVIGSAIAFRVVMLFSLPIQEVDIYRYLWDGVVSTAGVSPFRYSPMRVNKADASTIQDADLIRLVKIREDNPAIAEILNRVHFPELPTIYPPSSQAVFAAATLTTPPSSSLLTRLFVMKAWLVGFDVATLFVVIGLLRRCGKPVGRCVIYAWCPLMMKEVANSGHLDAIAVFLTASGVLLCARWLFPAGQPHDADQTHGADQTHDADQTHGVGDAINSINAVSKTVTALLIAIVLGLAVGAKLYPVVLAPLVLFTLARKQGWRFTVAPAAAFVLTSAVLLSAMVPGQTNSGEPAVAQTGQGDDPSLGVVTFLRRWEMNDFLFLILIENIKPTSHLGPHETAWFTVVPESIRQTTVNYAATRLNVDSGEAPFMIARAITAVVFLVFAVTLAWRTAPKGLDRFCEAAFLTIAWFWLLCPTLNPWYWTWAMPLLPFARGRAWLVVSGLVLMYYLRFWLVYHFPTTAVLGSPYTGAAFFDFVVTWIEFAPWLLALIVGGLLRIRYPNGRTTMN